MRKPIVGIALALVLVAAIVVPAAAITYGAVNSEHPYVGLVGFFDENGNWLWRCSGTLLSEDVFLTAAHCASPDPEIGTPAHRSALVHGVRRGHRPRSYPGGISRSGMLAGGSGRTGVDRLSVRQQVHG